MTRLISKFAIIILMVVAACVIAYQQGKFDISSEYFYSYNSNLIKNISSNKASKSDRDSSGKTKQLSQVELLISLKTGKVNHLYIEKALVMDAGIIQQEIMTRLENLSPIEVEFNSKGYFSNSNKPLLSVVDKSISPEDEEIVNGIFQDLKISTLKNGKVELSEEVVFSQQIKQLQKFVYSVDGLEIQKKFKRYIKTINSHNNSIFINTLNFNLDAKLSRSSPWLSSAEFSSTTHIPIVMNKMVINRSGFINEIDRSVYQKKMAVMKDVIKSKIVQLDEINRKSKQDLKVMTPEEFTLQFIDLQNNKDVSSISYELIVLQLSQSKLLVEESVNLILQGSLEYYYADLLMAALAEVGAEIALQEIFKSSDVESKVRVSALVHIGDLNSFSNETIKLLVDSHDDEKYLDGNGGNVLGISMLTLGRLGNTAFKNSKEQAKVIEDILVGRLINPKISEKTAAVILGVGNLQKPNLISKITPFINDDDPTTRMFALQIAVSLAPVKQDPNSDKIYLNQNTEVTQLAAFDLEEDPLIRTSIVRSLNATDHIVSPQAVNILLDQYLSEANSSVRLQILKLVKKHDYGHLVRSKFNALIAVETNPTLITKLQEL